MKNDKINVENRRAQILSMVRNNDEISVEELASRCGVSSMTIRRDLKALGEKGSLVHMHGKAVTNDRAREMLRTDDLITRCRAAISSYAASHIEDGNEIFINGSMTALGMLRHLKGKRVHVITNNGNALSENYPDEVRITLTGGEVYHKIMVGEYVMQNLLRMHADKTFLGCAAVYDDGEFRYDIPTEIGINEIMISRTHGELYILADHAKLRKRDGYSNTYGSFRYNCPVTLITDSYADAEIVRSLRENGITVIQVP